MSIPYADGTKVNYTFTSDATRRKLVDELAAQLAIAGWSYVSGSGTADVLMRSATTPKGQYTHLRLYDPGANNCAQFIIRNAAGTVAAAPMYILPVNGKTRRIIANKYQFITFTTGAADRLTARSFAAAGVPWMPQEIVDTLGSNEVGWTFLNGVSDSTTTTPNTLRTSLHGFGSLVINGTATDVLAGSPFPTLCTLAGDTLIQQWANGMGMKTLAYIATPTTPQIYGALWDAFIYSLSVAGESTYSHDSKTFLSITDNNAYAAPRGSLMVVVP